MELLSKLKSCGELATILRGLRDGGQVVVFTNGCFDLLHAGHVRYLAAAAARGRYPGGRPQLGPFRAGHQGRHAAHPARVGAGGGPGRAGGGRLCRAV
ncbi:MAG: hypothetical protein MZV70_07480 [Desulfobacterales bacterium]|nr:hypothetical protein [Desulfobacterales bacterium]